MLWLARANEQNEKYLWITIQNAKYNFVLF